MRKQDTNDGDAATIDRGTIPGAVLTRLGIAPAPVLRCGSPRAPVTVTRLRSTAIAEAGKVELPRDAAWAFHVHLRDVDEQRLWLDGMPVPVTPHPAGSTGFHDLRRALAVSVVDPLDAVRVVLPGAALDELAEEVGAPRVARLDFRHGVAVQDPVIRDLAGNLLRAAEQPGPASRLYVDHLALAFRAHVAGRYGGMETVPRLSQGGLAGWQERRAKEMLGELATPVRLAEVAQRCGLSVSHFARAFKQCTGQPPHRWLLHRRVARAKELLRRNSPSLAEVALSCGFADQSHFNRVFSQLAGATPGAWRRRCVAANAPLGLELRAA